MHNCLHTLNQVQNWKQVNKTFPKSNRHAKIYQKLYRSSIPFSFQTTTTQVNKACVQSTVDCANFAIKPR